MPWQGTAPNKTFTRTNGVNTGDTAWAQDAASPGVILSSRHDAHDTDLRNGINNCLAKNGDNTATANIPMGNFRFTGLGNASALDQAITATQYQNDSIAWCNTSTGTANAHLIASSISPTGYVAGQRVTFIPGFRNTAATTINMNSLGVKTVKRLDGNDLFAGDFDTTRVVTLVYNGTNFILINSQDLTLLERQNNYTSVTNTTTETTIFAKTIPAGMLGVNRGLKVSILGNTYSSSNLGTVPVYTVRVKFGGTTMFTYTGSHTANVASNVATANLFVEMHNANATNSQVFQHVFYRGNTNSAAGTVATSFAEIGNLQNTSTINTTVDTLLDITFQWSSANAALFYQRLGAKVELI